MSEANLAKSAVVKRSVMLLGHKTSVSLEAQFWDAAKQIAFERDITLSDFVTEIDEARHQRNNNLSSAIRLAVLAHYQALARQKMG